jgi:hypothetical protein
VTNAELLNLLREARVCIEEVAAFGRLDAETNGVLKRIDAAFADRAEGSTEDVVESVVKWRQCLAVDESTFLAASLSDKLKVFIYPEEATAGAYPWRATWIETKVGTATTEAEAKSAAIAAARGMR